MADNRMGHMGVPKSRQMGPIPRASIDFRAPPTLNPYVQHAILPHARISVYGNRRV